jgi:lysophospholipase L1-like esterase
MGFGGRDRRWRRALCGALLAALITCGGIAGARPQGAIPDGSVGKRVFVIGDSLAVGTRPYLGRDLGGWRVQTSASISKNAVRGAQELVSRGRHLPPVVVASLGTNDDPHAVTSFQHSVRSALGAVGKHGCVVWPNIVRPAVGGATYAGFNRVLARLAVKRDNLRIVDWVSMAAHNRGWFGADGVHPNATGYMARARVIARQVRRCRRSLVE